MLLQARERHLQRHLLRDVLGLLGEPLCTRRGDGITCRAKILRLFLDVESSDPGGTLLSPCSMTPPRRPGSVLLEPIVRQLPIHHPFWVVDMFVWSVHDEVPYRC